MYCRKCGKVVKDGEEYCTSCKDSMKIVCPHCGKKTNTNDKFCEHCDGYLGKSGENKNTSPKTTQSTNHETAGPKKTCMACGRQIPKDAFFCPICKKMSNTAPAPAYTNHSSTSHIVEGSYGAGFALGFLLGLIGLIIGIALDKSETKRGALHGFLTELVISIILVVVVSCATCSALGVSCASCASASSSGYYY